MLPVYLSYITGQETGRRRSLTNASGFVLGFSLLFISLGAFAGWFGDFLREYHTAVNIVCGAVMILFGFNFIGVIRLPFINNNRSMGMTIGKSGFIPSVVFGIVFSISWTPCVGTFLGSALMLAAQGGSGVKGIIMLSCFSAGLGVPFIASAVLIDRLKGAFDFIKQHYRAVTIISGILLIALGLIVATGMIGYLYAWV